MIGSSEMTAGPTEPASACKEDIVAVPSGLAPLHQSSFKQFRSGGVVRPDVVEGDCSDLAISGRLVKRVFVSCTSNSVKRVKRQDKWSGRQSIKNKVGLFRNVWQPR